MVCPTWLIAFLDGTKLIPYYIENDKVVLKARILKVEGLMI
jgi:hypothetical protein